MTRNVTYDGGAGLGFRSGLIKVLLSGTGRPAHKPASADQKPQRQVGAPRNADARSDLDFQSAGFGRLPDHQTAARHIDAVQRPRNRIKKYAVSFF